MMIMLKHNQHHQITFLFVHLAVKTQIQQPNKNLMFKNLKPKSKLKDVRAKSPTKTNTDLHNNEIKFWFSPLVILLGNIGSSIMLNHHSIIHLNISLTLTLLQCLFNTQLSLIGSLKIVEVT